MPQIDELPEAPPASVRGGVGIDELPDLLDLPRPPTFRERVIDTAGATITGVASAVAGVAKAATAGVPRASLSVEEELLKPGDLPEGPPVAAPSPPVSTRVRPPSPGRGGAVVEEPVEPGQPTAVTETEKEAGKGLVRGVLQAAESVGTGVRALGTALGPGQETIASQIAQIRHGKQSFAELTEPQQARILSELESRYGSRDPGRVAPGLAPTTARQLQEAGGTIEEFWRKAQKPFERAKELQGSILDNPGLLIDPRWLAGSIAETAPSLAAAVIPALGAQRAVMVGGKALALTPELITKLSRIGMAVTGGGAGGALEGASTYQTVIEQGGSEQDALGAATWMGLASAGLNAISLDRMLPKGELRLSAGATSRIAKLKKALKDGGVEGLTEWLEEPAEAIILGDPIADRAKEGLNVVPPSLILGALASGAAQVRRRAPASFVGYDTTGPEPQPVFVTEQDLGEVPRGALVTGAALEGAGFELPKHPPAKGAKKEQKGDIFESAGMGPAVAEEPTEAPSEQPTEPVAAAAPAIEELPAEAPPEPKPGEIVTWEAAQVPETVTPDPMEALDRYLALHQQWEDALNELKETGRPDVLAAKGGQPAKVSSLMAKMNTLNDQMRVIYNEHTKAWTEAGVEFLPPGPAKALPEAPPAAKAEAEAAPPAEAAVRPAEEPTEAPRGGVGPVKPTRVTVRYPDDTHQYLANLPGLVAKAEAAGTPDKARRYEKMIAAQLGLDPAEVLDIAKDYRQAIEEEAKGMKGGTLLPPTLDEVLRRRAVRAEQAGPPVEAPTAPAAERPVPPPAVVGAEGPTAGPTTPKLAPKVVFDPVVADEALKRLRKRFGRLPSPEQMATGGRSDDEERAIVADAIAYGGMLYEQGITDYDVWASRMAEDIGPEVQEYLDVVFDLVQSKYEEEGGGPVGPDRGEREGALETIPAGGVQGAPGEGAPEPERVPGRGPDERGAGERPAPGNGPVPGVGGGEGPVGVPAERAEGGAPAGGISGEPFPVEQPPREPLVQAGPDDAVVHPPAATRGADFAITDADGIGSGAAKAKFTDNVAAIRLLKQIEGEGRPATLEEQKILARYVGWGGLKWAFDPFAGSRGRGGSQEDYQALKGLLTPEEYDAAERTILNAHFTSIPVVRGMWEAVKRLGYRGGRMIETSAGVGNILGAMPADLRPSARSAVEQDDVSGRLLRLLYPEARIIISPFEKVSFPNDFYDLAISNVPFGDIKVADTSPAGREYRKAGLTALVHDYFFAKALDKVRPGGLVAFITSTGTLDKQDRNTRVWLAQRAELVGAMRLPDQTFKANALTEVTTDFIILKKREKPISAEEATKEPWIATRTIAVPDERGYGGSVNLHLNAYYHDHPEMVLGTHSISTLYAGQRLGATLQPGESVEARMAAAIARLPEGIYAPAKHDATDPTVPATQEALTTGGVKPGGFTYQKGKLYQDRGELTPGGERKLSLVTGMDKEDVDRIVQILGIRDAMNEALGVQVRGGTDDDLRAAQASLNKIYDAFVKKWTREPDKAGKGGRQGVLHARENIRLMTKDPDWPRLLGLLERWDPASQTASKSPFFSERTIRVQERPTSAPDGLAAMMISLNETGKLAWDRMTELTGKSRLELQRELAGRIFRNPEGTWETADEYLSGNVRSKLAAAREAAKADPGAGYEGNVTALEAVQPKDWEPHEIRARLGAVWIEPAEVVDFMAEILGLPETRIAVSRNEITNRWHVAVDGGRARMYQATREWGTERANFVDLVKDALEQTQPTVYDRMDDGSRVLNTTETEAAREKLRAIKERFGDWAWEDEDRRTRLAAAYNERFNSIRLYEPDGGHLTLPGISPSIHLRKHQLDDIWRITQKGNTLITRIVGSGKSFEMIGAMMEAKRLGIAKKPMWVVDNPTLAQTEQDFLRMYPAANLLAAGPGDLGLKSRRQFMSRIASANWDAVIVPQTSFGMLPVSEETFRRYMKEQVDELRAVMLAEMAELGQGAERSPSIREMVQAIKKLESYIETKAATLRKDVTIGFEELGIDMLVVDEAHAYKRLQAASRMRNIAGINTAYSDRAFDMFIKTQYINRLTNGRGVVFATGTPISNTLGETYVMMKYLMPEALKAAGIRHFDQFVATFASVKETTEFTVTGTYRPKSRLARFQNLPGMLQLFRSVATPQGTNESLGIEVPAIATGKSQAIRAEMDEAQLAYMQSLQDRAKRLTRDRRVDNMLKISTQGRMNAIDARLVMPDAPENPTSKANRTVEKAFEIWQRTKDQKFTQMIFLDIAAPKGRGKVTPGAKREKPKWKMTLLELADYLEIHYNEDSEMGRQLVALHVSEIMAAINEGETIPENVIASIPEAYRQGVQEAIAAQAEGEGPPDEETADVETAEERLARQQIYGEIRQKLIARGVPEREIAFIHDAKNKAEKQVLFDRMNTGDLRILLGSTKKMGQGVNAQRLMKAQIHVDVPYIPADLEQRVGRAIRQGNLVHEDYGEEVEIYHIVSEGATGIASFDTFMWQLVAKKANFIRQIMNGEVNQLETDDIDLAPDETEFIGIASGDPRIMERINVEQELMRLRRLKKYDDDARQRMKIELATTLPEDLRRQKADVAQLRSDIARYEEHKADPFSLKVGDRVYEVRDQATAALEKIREEQKNLAQASYSYSQPWHKIGEYRGFDLESELTGGSETGRLRLRQEDGIAGEHSYTFSVQALDGLLRGMSTRVLTRQQDLAKTQMEITKRQQALTEPFKYDGQIADLSRRYAELNTELNIRTAADDIIHAPVEAEREILYEEGAEEGPEQMLTGFLPRGENRYTAPAGAAPAAPTPGAAPPGTAAPGGGPLSRKDVLIQEATEALAKLNAGALTLQGGFRGPESLHGQRDPQSGNIRLRQITDVDTFAHEMGHAIQNPLHITLSNLMAFKQEMNALVALQGVKGGSKMREGFAEFMRLYVTDPAAARATAPTFFPWFEARLSTQRDLEAVVQQLRDGVLRLRGASPVERAIKAIAFEEERPLSQQAREALAAAPASFSSVMNMSLQGIFDQNRAFDRLERLLDPGQELPADQSLYKMATTVSARAIDVARTFIEEAPVRFGTLEKIPGARSYVDIIRPVWGPNEKRYTAYEIMRRIQSLELDTDNPRHLGAAEHLRAQMDMRRVTGRPDDLADAVTELERLHPEFSGVLDELQVFNDHLLQYLADSGRYSQEVIDAIRESLPWVPLHRLMDPTAKIGGPGTQGFANTRRLFGLRGKSERIILPTLTDRYKNVMTIIATAERNDVMAQFATLMESPRWAGGKNLGSWADKVAMPIRATTFQLDAIRNTLLKALTDSGLSPANAALLLDSLDMSTLATVYAQVNDPSHPNRVMLWRDGKPEVWEIHNADLLRTILQLDRFQVEHFMRGVAGIMTLLRGSATLFRVGTVGTPDFLIGTNIPRDQQAALIQGRGIIPPWFRGFSSSFRDLFGISETRLKEIYERGGGDVFAHGTYNERAVRKNLAYLIEGPGRHRYRWLLKKAGQLVNLSDNPTRYGVARIVYQKPRPQDVGRPRALKIEGSYRGRQATIDWGQKGGSQFIQAWSMTAAFMRAGLNVLYRAGKTYSESARAIRRGDWSNPYLRHLLIAAATMWFAETLLYLWQKDDPRYADQSIVEKGLYWTFIPKPITREEWNRLTIDERLEITKRWDQGFKIVKEPLHGFLFGTIWRLTYEAWAKADPVGGIASILKGLGMTMAVGVLPTLARPPLEIALNRDLFFDRRIVPLRAQEGLISEQRFGPFTSEVAKAIGQTSMAKRMDLSPYEIDHIVRGYFGALGRYTTDAVDALTGYLEGDRPPAPEWRISDYPIMRRLTLKYPNVRGQSVEEFYEFRKRAHKALFSLRDAAKRGDAAAEMRIHRDYGFEIAMVGLTEATADVLSNTKKQIDQARGDKFMVPGPGRDAIDRLLLAELAQVDGVMESIRLARARFNEQRQEEAVFNK